MDSKVTSGNEPASENDLFWAFVSALFARWRLVAVVTSVAAIASVIVSLFLPVWFTASSRLILPEAPGNSLASLLGGSGLSSTAKSLLGGATGGYSRYLTILTSRTVRLSLIEEFDLVRVFELENSDAAEELALLEVASRIDYAIDGEYEFMSIRVTDKDRQRAADMANFLADELNHVNSQLTSQTASNFRIYVDQRFALALQERDSLLNAIESFQEQYGVYDLETQTEVFFAQIGELRAGLIQSEIEYEALRDRFGSENAQVATAFNLVRAARRKYTAALDGKEDILPVSQDSLPSVFREYALLELERTIQARVVETLAPIVEQAKFDELRVAEAVQIVDRAMPPAFKSKPKRAVFCAAVTTSVFMLCILFILFRVWSKRMGRYVTARLDQSRAELL